MSVLKFLLKRKLIVGLLVVFVLIIGLYASTKLDKELFPPITMDGASVYVSAGDLAALDVEERITKPIEQTLQGIDGVDYVESTSSIGNSSLMIGIEEGRGDEVYKEIDSSLQSLRSQLLDVEDLSTFQFSTNSTYEFYMDISAGDKETMTNFALDVVEPRLEALREVRDVNLVGLDTKEVIIELKEDKLEEYGLDIHQVVGFIQQSNQNVAVGELSGETNEPTLRWDTSYQSVDDLKSISIPTMEGMKKISDIATVKEQSSEQTHGLWKNGSSNFIFVQIGRVADVTQIELAEAIRAEVEKIEKEGLVQGFEFNEIVAQADYVSDAIDGVTQNVLIGGVIALLVLLLFLRNIRATIIIGLSIPLSILLTFSAMWYFDYSFNMLSLVALGLGIGMMVDASIVILESIFKKKEQGLQSLDAVLQGTKEVATAVFASMLTTIVVFLPIGILGGDAGKFVIILSVVVCITLVSSVIVSFTLIPSLAENFLKVSDKANKRQEGSVTKKYGQLISWMGKKKRYRYSVIFAFFLVFASSLLVVTKVPMTIMPDVFNRYSELMIQLESGLTPKEREEIAIEVSKKMDSITDVTNTIVMDEVSVMYAIINMSPEEEATLSQKEVNEQILSSVRSLEDDFPVVSVQSATSVGGGGYPVAIEIQGESFDVLSTITSDLQQELSEIDGIVGITSTTEKLSEEQQIKLKEKKLEDENISPLEIQSKLDSLFASQQIGELHDGNRTKTVFIKSDEGIEKKADVLNVELLSPVTGEKEKLSTFLSLEPILAPTQIDRKDGTRYVRVLADIEGVDLGTVNREISKLVADFKTPAGYSVSISGDLETQQEAMMDLLLVLVISLFLVYVVMAVQFNSFKHPIIVMSIIPLTITGVIFGLLLTQRELSIMSGIGVIMLIGIVLNNAILLIDRTNQLREEKMDISEAVSEAGKNRLRPIFMTTLTTVGGMIPLAIATGTASNYQAPMATVVISGLLFATMITLVLIPAVYLLFEDMTRGLRAFASLFSRKKTKVKREERALAIQAQKVPIK
ncbi:efflux RND transporter permease subunit [Alkalihalobacterium bogoriense]|uniref:efflux RND transporter permease subunit n=1 Tax=Alkalihalobacterium bogoriense TaxID=246272 RepID=UPI00047D708D|nr:efflux RND transporter permease subunit [Alkalihalobacterium bogoriense]